MVSYVAPSKGLRSIIEALIASVPAAAALFTGYNIYHGNLNEDDNTIAFIDSGGAGAEPLLNLDYASCQVLVRGSPLPGSYDQTYNVLLGIKDALLGIPSSPTAYPDLIACNLIGSIMPLGYDANKRPVFSLNFRLHLVIPVSPLSHRVEI